LKILFFTTAPFNPGGPGKWYYEITQQIEKRGFTTYVVSWGQKENILYLHPRLQLIKYLNFPKNNFFKYTNFIQTMLLSAFILKKFIKKYDIKIVHSGGIFESFGAALGIGECPLVTTIHGDYITELNDFLSNHNFIKIFKIYYNLLELYSIYKTKIITLPSFWLYSRLKERLKNKRVIIIPNGVTIPTYIDKYLARKSLKLENDKLIFIIVTNFNSIFKFKSMEMLIHAFRRVKNLGKIKIIVLGAKHNTVVKNWDKMIMKEAFGLPIEFRGFQKNIYNYLFAADVLLHPSFLDNQPISIIEAMACGKPVVASNIGGIPEIFSNGRGGMLLNNSIETWTETINHIIEGMFDLENMGSEGKKIVEQKFSWEIIIKQYENLYKQLVEIH
jgi:glycosyltransferase involved in cell wall biosynthesis